MDIHICVYNIENLFIQKASPLLPPDTPYKSEKKLEDLKKVFNDINADIYALCEVGGEESLIHFNVHYLDNQYHVALIKGNSDRGIEIGYLIRKSLPFRYNLGSYKKVPLNFNYPHELRWKEEDPSYNLPTHLMSRNLLELSLYNFDDPKKEHPILNLFLVHLKSQRDNESIDFRSIKRRKAEAEFSLKQVNHFKQKHPHCPIIICGDFNGNASENHTDDEFESIYKIYHLQDVLSIKDLPVDNRATYFLFNGSTRLPTQLDYAFMYQENSDLVKDACVYSYKNELDRPKNLPKNKYDVWNNPSDHYPLVFTLDL